MTPLLINLFFYFYSLFGVFKGKWRWEGSKLIVEYDNDILERLVAFLLRLPKFRKAYKENGFIIKAGEKQAGIELDNYQFRITFYL